MVLVDDHVMTATILAVRLRRVGLEQAFDFLTGGHAPHREGVHQQERDEGRIRVLLGEALELRDATDEALRKHEECLQKKRDHAQHRVNITVGCGTAITGGGIALLFVLGPLASVELAVGGAITAIAGGMALTVAGIADSLTLDFRMPQLEATLRFNAIRDEYGDGLNALEQ